MAHGVVVIVNGGGPERIRRSLDRMVGHRQGGGGSARESVVLGRVTLAVTDPRSIPSTPRTAATDDVALAISGRLFDQGLSNGSGEPDARALLHLFLTAGRGSLEGLNGDYLVAVWEESARRLTIVNDRFGLRRLYYWVTGHRLVAAPVLSAFTALPEFPQTVDEFAIADYLSTGHHVDGRTWFSSVRLLLPASVLTLAGGHLSIRTYWQFRVADSPPSGGVTTWVATHLAALESAVRRRLPGTGEPLALWTGDPHASRALEALLAEKGRTFARVAEDRSGAAENPDGVNPDPGMALAASDGCRPCRAVRLARVAAALGGGARTVFSDHLADIVTTPLPGTADPRPGPCTDPAASLPCVFREEEIRQILRADVYRLVQGATGDRLARLSAEASGARPGVLAQETLRRRQYESPLDLELFARDAQVLTPFLDPGVVEAARAPQGDAAAEGNGRNLGSEPHSGPRVVGTRRGCAHTLSGVWHALVTKDPVLGDYFRLPRLQELIGSHPEGRAGAADKLCVLEGIALALTTLRGAEPGQRDSRSERHASVDASATSVTVS